MFGHPEDCDHFMCDDCFPYGCPFVISKIISGKRRTQTMPDDLDDDVNIDDFDDDDDDEESDEDEDEDDFSDDSDEEPK